MMVSKTQIQQYRLNRLNFNSLKSGKRTHRKNECDESERLLSNGSPVLSGGCLIHEDCHLSLTSDGDLYCAEVDTNATSADIAVHFYSHLVDD
ncbi:hypothetical protein R1flu_011674 [Riccia fluitans]|uniref:Uncharacterized protein n=1 Tax=Riccia fluitans TaxID=41844 RepID=A0ABD1ZCN2_9MARC